MNTVHFNRVALSKLFHPSMRGLKVLNAYSFSVYGGLSLGQIPIDWNSVMLGSIDP
jgi:hypothetical protein